MEADTRALIGRYQALTGLVETMRQATHDVAVERGRVAAQLNDRGFGYGKLARMLGITKSRVQQVVASGR